MNRVIDLLNTSSRPLILLGAGARQARTDILGFAEYYHIPVQTTWNAVDLVPHNHPLFAGRPGIHATRGANKTIQNCDLLIAIGARLDEPTIAYNYEKFAPLAKKVMVDVDTGESLKIPNIDVFIHMDAGKFIKELFDAQPNIETDEKWMEYCEEWDRLEGSTMTYRLMELLSDELPDDAILVVNNGGFAINVFSAGFRNKAGQRFIMSSCGLGSMGAAVSVAIGVAIASGKQVYCIDGDGSFMQNVSELEVVRRLNLPILFLVMDNGGYMSIKNSEIRAFGRHKTLETIPNIKDVAEGFGVHAIDYLPYFDVGIMNMYGTPLVIVVKTEEAEQLLPRVMFDGRGNLGDMYPYE